MRLAPELVEVLVSGQECILNRVLRVGCVAQVAIGLSIKQWQAARENSLHFPIFLFANADREGRLLRVNDTFCGIVGYPREELLGKAFRDLTYPDDPAADPDGFGPLWRGEFPSSSQEQRYARKDGSPVWVSLSSSVVSGFRDEPLYFISQMEDVSDRRRVEQELRRQQDDTKVAA